MKITVKGYLTLRKAMGNHAMLEMEIERATLRGLLGDLSGRFGEGFKDLMFDPKTNEVNDHIRVLVNGRHYNYLPEKLDTQLEEGDEVSLFPPVAGG